MNDYIEKYNIPDAFYDIKIYNEISLIIIGAFNSAFYECKSLLELEGNSKYQNLVAVFYHHLNTLFCSYLFSKYELDLCGINNKDELNKIAIFDSKRFPGFVNYSDIIDDNFITTINKKKIKGNSLKIIARKIISRAYYYINNKMVFFNKPSTTRVLFSRNVSLDNNFIKKIAWRKRLFHFKIEDKSNNIFIPHFNKQFNYLINSVQNIEPDLQRIWPIKYKISNKFFMFIMKELKTHLTANAPKSFAADILVTGCGADLHARKLAANAKLFHVPVIDVWHAEETGTLDEPIFGPGEQTFSDANLGYGDYGCSELQKGRYCKGLFENPKVISGSSERVKKLYQGKDVKQLPNLSDSNVMYVTTLFRGSRRYGPFMTFHDLAYLSWQKEMLKSVKEIMKPKRLIRKAHRKGVFNFPFELSGVENLREPDLLKIIDIAELFIFDRPTVAFVFAAATNKPIIYFDIGIRNFMSEALKSIKERCIYVKGDPKSAKSLVKRAFKGRKKKCVNTYTERYSLSQDPRLREEILIDWINNYNTVHQ